jgi:hypothetical protein
VIDRAVGLSELVAVFSGKKERRYFEAWLQRSRKQFAISGRLSQVATVLAEEEGQSVEAWRQRLRVFLDGDEVPSLELLTRIDALLVGILPNHAASDSQAELF